MTLTYGILFYSLLHYSVLILLTSNTVRLVGKDAQTKLITSMFYRVNIQWLTPWLMRNRSNPNSTCKHNPNHTKTWSFIIYLLYYTAGGNITFHSILLQSGERVGTVTLHLLRNTYCTREAAADRRDGFRTTASSEYRCLSIDGVGCGDLSHFGQNTLLIILVWYLLTST